MIGVKGRMIQIKNCKKRGFTVFVVCLFLLFPSMIANAKMLSLASEITEQKVKSPLFDTVSEEPDITTPFQSSTHNQISINSHSVVPSQKYAVIMVGRYFGRWNFFRPKLNLQMIQQFYIWYLRDAARVYVTLRDTYGYDEENIVLLVRLLPDFFEVPEDFDISWIDYVSSESNLENLLNMFELGGERELAENDSLFFCFIDHGLTDGEGNTYFGCPFQTIPQFFWWIFGQDPQKLYDYELASYVSDIHARLIFALQPCSSGGFIDDLSGENRIICTASRDNETANAPWIGLFRAALNNATLADYNQDGKISILEAYQYAAEEVQHQIDLNPDLGPQHPLIDDNGDSIGHHYTEPGYNPETEGEDGYLASSTFL